jgi:hypothetical protein
MLTISKPLSAAQARAYHANEFSNAHENYYTTADQIRGQWHGQLARQWGLHGEVLDDQFARLAEGSTRSPASPSCATARPVATRTRTARS